MKTIDLSCWNRRKHFELFKTYRQPFFNVCFELDLTTFLPAIKAEGKAFFLSFVHAVMKAANRTEALRLRIRGEEVVLHERVRPSFTMMTDAGVFRFVTVSYDDDQDTFLRRAVDTVEAAKTDVSIADEPGVDDLVFITSMPWLSFTAIEHAMPGHPDDSFPRLTWGKYREVSGRIMIPFSVAAHHALVDGSDVGAFAATLQALLNDR
ncbi:MAG: chloramphenicol acetyltransferase [Bacillota bacterium]|nr:chloramphenicol acetyltransferase [Bacillota bacterium]